MINFSSDANLEYALIGAIGVILGALINTVMQIFNSVHQRKADAHLSTRRVREEQYFAATETLNELLNELQAFQVANSGLGVSEGKTKSVLPWRNFEYKRADRRSADAFTELWAAAKAVELQKSKMAVVGSLRASESFSDCYSIVRSYMSEVVDQMNDDGRFIFSVSEEYIDAYKEKYDDTVKLFRSDLRVRD